MKLLVTLPVQVYKRLISPLLPASCRFYPSCSDYALQAVEEHGLCKGVLMAVWRIFRCHPWQEGGYDPVPPGTTDNLRRTT